MDSLSTYKNCCFHIKAILSIRLLCSINDRRKIFEKFLNSIITIWFFYKRFSYILRVSTSHIRFLLDFLNFKDDIYENQPILKMLNS